MARIGLVSGSTRQASFNTILAQAAGEILKNLGAEVFTIDHSALPLMNQDIEFPVLPEVAKVRDQVRNVDALWFFTPQHNHSTTAALKNFLDWMSRRDTPEAPREESVLFEKPGAVSGISGPAAAVQARAEVHKVAQFIGMKMLQEPEAGLVLPGSAWATGEYSPSEDDLAALRAQAEAFLAFIG